MIWRSVIRSDGQKPLAITQIFKRFILSKKMNKKRGLIVNKEKTVWSKTLDYGNFIKYTKKYKIQCISIKDSSIERQ